MHLTPERLETVPTKAAQEDATQGSAAKGTPPTLVVEAPLAQAEGLAEAKIIVQATVTKTTPAPQEVPRLACMCVHLSIAKGFFLICSCLAFCVISTPGYITDSKDVSWAAGRGGALEHGRNAKLQASAGSGVHLPHDLLRRFFHPMTTGAYKLTYVGCLQALPPPQVAPGWRLKSAVKLTSSYDHRYLLWQLIVCAHAICAWM